MLTGSGQISQVFGQHSCMSSLYEVQNPELPEHLFSEKKLQMRSKSTNEQVAWCIIAHV